MVKLISFILLSGLVLIRGEQFEDETTLKEFQNLKKLKPLGLEFADYFQNVTLNDLSLFDSNLPTQEDLLCLSEMGQLMLALRSGQFWALKMIDSWGSIPSGLFTGNVYDFGNFDECINIKMDSFFFIGGLLVSLIALRLMDRTKGKLNVPMMYLRRLLRIVPILAMAILVYTQLTGLLGDGPLFKGGYNGKASCEKSWYLTMLFVVNFANDMCLDHTWYLAVDMQLFLISPLLLFALYKWGKKAAAGIFVLIVLLSGCLFAEMMVNNYSILNLDLTLQKKMYFYTHTHAAPWLIGFLFGYFLYLSKGKKFQLSWFSVWTGWILSLALLFTSIFALYPAVMSGIPKATTLELSLYYTLTRVGWPMAIGWVVFACMQGYGSLANSFLSSPLWQPISKLSYSAYIWHSFIQEINQRITRTNTYFSDYQVMLDFWSTLGLTLLFSYLMYLIIEAPIGGLDLLLRPQKKAPAEIKTVTDSDLGKENRIDDGNSTKHGDLEATELNTQTAAD
uniref:Nose resistant to fluoxetine protein 6-like n=1 Tax=Drosophila rhopaloa TaxID=1041015 RepID=A0A6P4FNW1_DRORH